MEIRKYYDKKPNKGITFTQPSMAQQQFAEEANINNIMARYNTTGLLTDPLNPSTRQYEFGDFSTLPEFRDAQETIIEAKNLFNQMPARVRAEFNNDPGLFLDFCSNDQNIERMYDLGIIERETPILEIEPKEPKEPLPDES